MSGAFKKLAAQLPQNPKHRGIFCVIVAMFFLSVMAALGKHLAENYSVYEVVFFRCLFALLPLMPLIARRGGMKALYTKNFIGHFWRNFMGLASMLLYFFSLHLLPLADAVVIFFTNPLFITLFSMLLLKEQVGRRRWVAIVIGFIGVIIVAAPKGFIFNAGVVCGLLSAMVSGFAMISLRHLGKTESALSTTSWFTILSTVFSVIPAAFFWKAPGFADLLVFVLCGVIAGIGQLFLSKAYQLAAPSVISPFNYSSILWAVLFGLLWGHFPEAHVLLGSAIVVASGIYIIHRERMRHGARGVRPETLPPSP